jgi:hypothetical protein
MLSQFKKCLKMLFYSKNVFFYSVKEKHSHFNERGLKKQTRHIERGI